MPVTDGFNQTNIALISVKSYKIFNRNGLFAYPTLHFA